MVSCNTLGCKPGQWCMNCAYPGYPSNPVYPSIPVYPNSNPAYPNTNRIYPSTVWYYPPPKIEGTMKIPELYPNNLETLKHIIARMDLFSKVEGVQEVEVRIRIDDLDTWAVIGYGESGDPCLLRFEPK